MTIKPENLPEYCEPVRTAEQIHELVRRLTDNGCRPTTASAIAIWVSAAQRRRDIGIDSDSKVAYRKELRRLMEAEGRTPPNPFTGRRRSARVNGAIPGKLNSRRRVERLSDDFQSVERAA